MLFAQELTAISPTQLISVTFPAETCPKNSRKPCKNCYIKLWIDIWWVCGKKLSVFLN